MLSITLSKKLTKNKNKIIKELLKNSIETRSIWKPLHLQKPYRIYETYKVSNSEKFFHTTLNLPSSTNLNNLELSKIISILKKIFKK